MNKTSKEAGITFGIRNSRKSKQLYIQGPKKILEGMYVPMKVGRSYPYKLEVTEEDEIATWKLNAGAIGRMNNAQRQSLSESLESANEFIGSVVRSIADGDVAGDPKIDIYQYGITDEGFGFSAEIKKPSIAPSVAEMVVKNSVVSIAEDLNIRECEPQIYVHETKGLGVVSGLNMAIGSGSSVTTIDKYDETFELLGSKIPGGKQPLIYLAGAVAMAHVDELAGK